MKSVIAWDDLGRRDPPFLDEFRGFYHFVIECRKRVQAAGPVQQTVPDPASLQAIADNALSEAQNIHDRLLEALQVQAVNASRLAGPEGYERYREVQYVEAVLADEIFLYLDWRGREYWTTHILETKLFNTHTAGEMMFTRIERLLSDRNQGPEGIEMIYFLALSLGFQGKYRGRPDQTAILARYRRELYRRYYFRNATGLEKLQRAFPDAYEHTVDSAVPRRLPSPFRWIAALAMVVVVWLVATQIAWSNLTQDLRATIQEINKSSVTEMTGVADAK